MSVERYSRQTVLAEIGPVGQARLRESQVLVVGIGATGTVLANHLARAGVGTLRLVDRDWVEWNNLQRQLLYDEEDAAQGSPKAVAAERALRRVNSEIKIEGLVQDVTSATIEQLMCGVDLAVDGTDNFETRYVVNDACVRAGVPWVYTGVVATYGMSLFIHPGAGPCLRCVFPDPPPPGSSATCDTAGVLGPAVSVAASFSAAQALRWLTGDRAGVSTALLHVDAWEPAWHSFQVHRKPDCPCCGRQEFPFLAPSAGSHTVVLCGRNAVQITPPRPAAVDLDLTAARLRPLGLVETNNFLLRWRIGEQSLTLFRDGRAIVQGTTDETVALNLYSRYIGL